MITIELETRAQQDLLIRLLHREYARLNKKHPLLFSRSKVLEEIAEVIDIVEEAEGPEEE